MNLILLFLFEDSSYSDENPASGMEDLDAEPLEENDNMTVPTEENDNVTVPTEENGNETVPTEENGNNTQENIDEEAKSSKGKATDSNGVIVGTRRKDQTLGTPWNQKPKRKRNQTDFYSQE